MPSSLTPPNESGNPSQGLSKDQKARSLKEFKRLMQDRPNLVSLTSPDNPPQSQQPQPPPLRYPVGEGVGDRLDDLVTCYRESNRPLPPRLVKWEQLRKLGMNWQDALIHLFLWEKQSSSGNQTTPPP